MAKHILYNASITLNSVDLSDRVESISFIVEMGGQRADAMQDVEEYEMAGKRKVSPITLTFYQDFAAGEVYATLMTLWTNRTTFNCVMKADAGSTSATNPQFTVAVFVGTKPVISGTTGERHMSPVVLKPAGIMTIATS